MPWVAQVLGVQPVFDRGVAERHRQTLKLTNRWRLLIRKIVIVILLILANPTNDDYENGSVFLRKVYPRSGESRQANIWVSITSLLVDYDYS